MRQEGVLREFAPKGKGFEDAVLLSLLRREWEEGNEEGRMVNEDAERGQLTTDHRPQTRGGES
jgi:hypothetical protein